jgi:hypothetical protein
LSGRAAVVYSSIAANRALGDFYSNNFSISLLGYWARIESNSPNSVSVDALRTLDRPSLFHEFQQPVSADRWSATVIHTTPPERKPGATFMLVWLI